jgi:Flp pilus assembly pilin Flp
MHEDVERIWEWVWGRLRGQCGASTVEYAILAAFVAAVIVAVVQAVGGKVSSEFSTVNSLYP